ncbi:hypothetical protein OG858_46960 (plasmid) [Streptomyces europaeiscabiei]|uniref:hypothetical protein n=1 Tax=Streptomyces europaeiscabiei TaxID=146819 RepID=UPI002E81677B|nr:hypothetical protein [Streptomyces europaeiscabiei]WUD38850.1 hypothetical protein OG858_46960 [Streptomyces europaeiscabiei]
MRITSRDAQPEAAATIELFDLVVTGSLRKVEANADGSWTITPTVGQPLVLTGTAEVTAYIDRTHGTGPAALAPALTLPAPDTSADQDPEGCGCVPAVRGVPAMYTPDLMQARAISAGLGDFGVNASRRTAAYDETAHAVAVRVATDHGIYALHIPPVTRPFVVHRNGHRDGSLGVRRVPATSDSTISTLYAAYLRERGVL